MVNVESIIIKYINDNTNYICAAELSNPRVEDVTLETLGGNKDNYSTIKTCSLAIQTYGNSREEAGDIAYNLVDILSDIADNVGCIAKAVVGVPYNWTDREPRYQLTLDVKLV